MFLLHTESHTVTRESTALRIENGGRRWSATEQPKPQKMTMEEYLDFIHSQKQLHLAVDHLNQIVDMHGFKKIHKTHQGVLIEAVKTMELMDPSCSTLGHAGLSLDAFITLDDVIEYLNELKWQECCVTSLQTIKAVEHHQPQHQISNKESTALTIASASSEKPKRQRKKAQETR